MSDLSMALFMHYVFGREAVGFVLRTLSPEDFVRFMEKIREDAPYAAPDEPADKGV